jgi:hypothetical protein
MSDAMRLPADTQSLHALHETEALYRQRIDVCITDYVLQSQHQSLGHRHARTENAYFRDEQSLLLCPRDIDLMHRPTTVLNRRSHPRDAEPHEKRSKRAHNRCKCEVNAVLPGSIRERMHPSVAHRRRSSSAIWSLAARTLQRNALLVRPLIEDAELLGARPTPCMPPAAIAGNHQLRHFPLPAWRVTVLPAGFGRRRTAALFSSEAVV